MLYLVYGDDSDKARDKYSSLVNSLREKKPDASFFEVDSENFDEAKFEELIGGATLFANKFMVGCKRLYVNDKSREYISERVELIAESQNVFIFLEGELENDDLALLTEHADKALEFEITKKEGKKDFAFNVFSLTDALGRRDRRGLWLLATEAMVSGFPAEEIFWKFVWQVKNMLLVQKSKGLGAKELNLNPFVYTKTSSFLKNYTEQGIADMSLGLLVMYHEARRGTTDFDVALERFILSI